MSSSFAYPFHCVFVGIESICLLITKFIPVKAVKGNKNILDVQADHCF